MSRCASRSEHDLARRSVLRAARLADRRIRCWSPSGDYYWTEERLLWTAQHGDVVPRRVRDEAEATLLAYHGARLWWALEPLVSWRRIADCHQEALIVLLEVLRSGQVDAVSLRRRVPALAFEVACLQVLAYGGDATGGQR